MFGTWHKVEYGKHIINTINSPGMKRQFSEYISYALSEVFPGDSKVHAFVATMQHQLLPSETSV